MSRLRMLLPLLTFALAACGGGQLDQPYDVCAANDRCDQGTVCIQSTLPVVFSGFFCSNGCNIDQDCLQDFSNFPSICVNSACYLSCDGQVGSRTCPYGTECVSFVDQNNFETDLCTP